MSVCLVVWTHVHRGYYPSHALALKPRICRTLMLAPEAPRRPGNMYLYVMNIRRSLHEPLRGASADTTYLKQGPAGLTEVATYFYPF